MYGLIAFCVVLLFIVINLVLKKKDLKAELEDYRSLGYPAQSAADYSNGQDYHGQAYADDQSYDSRQESACDVQQDSMQYEALQYEAPQYEAPQDAAQADDPTTVPKPSKAKKQKKKMPEYQEPQQPEYTYQQPERKEGGKDKNVEVTMIDL